MATSSRLRIYLNLLWALLSLAVLGAFSAPLLLNDIHFPFWPTLIVFILVFMVAVRYIFFLRHSWLGTRQFLKTGLIILGIWGIFLLINALHDFRVYADETGLESIMGHLPDAEYTALSQFTRNTVIFFGVASVIATGILMLRLIISVWRWHNHRQV
jgi:hypothetical protein